VNAKRTIPVFIVVSVLLFTMDAALGAGFYTHDLGGKTMGRGAANVIKADDLNAMYLNPAGLARLRGTNFKLECVWGVLDIRYKREPWQDPLSNKNPGDIFPFIGISSDFGLNRWTFAFGVYGLYSISAYYDQEGPQRYAVVDTLTISPDYHLSVAWNPLDWLYIGGSGVLIGFRRYDHYAFSILGDEDLRYDVIAEFEAESLDAFAGAAGVIFRPWKHLEFGFSYFSKAKAILDGEIRAPLPDLYSEILGVGEYRDNVTLSAWMPNVVRGGVRFMFTDRTDIEFDVVWTGWHIQEDFVVDFEKAEIIDDFKIPKDNKDTWNFRIGGDLGVTDWLTLRTGYNYDQAAAPLDKNGPGGVETDRHQVGVGLTVSAWGVDVDLSYQHVFQESFTLRDPDMSSGLGDGRGEYQSAVDFYGLGINMNFGEFYRSAKGRDKNGGES